MKKNTLALTVATIASCSLVNMPVRAQTGSMSLDEMTIVLATIVTVGNSCPQKYRVSDDAPLGSIVTDRGYNLDDFRDNGRYAKQMELRMSKAIQFIQMYGTEKGCTGMRDAIAHYMPELYSSNSSPPPVIAQNESSKLSYIAIFNGRCKKLIVAGKNLTSRCSAKLLNLSYKVGRGAFWAPLSDGNNIVSFSGAKDEQPSLSKYILYLDKLLLNGDNFGENPIFQDFEGTCSVDGDFSKEVSTLKCQGKSKDGLTSEYEFITDGNPADVTNY
jgi:hypothetical protein